jgi:predicted XRE-type DNA-binding protein
VKAEVYRELLHYITQRGFSQQHLVETLGVHQPDVSNLLNGKVSKFSVGKLIQFAGKLNLGARIKLTKPKTAVLRRVSASSRARKPKTAAA